MANDNLTSVITVDSFWQFSITVYGEREIQKALLSFQDGFGGNVNLALLCQYCDKNKIRLTDLEINALHIDAKTFEKQFTQPLRELRRHYKERQSNIQDYLNVRRALLDAELVLEKQQQHELVTLLNNMMALDDFEHKILELDLDNWARYQAQLK
jgi:uncharacterized protein (TIGR02444 family)